MKNNYFYKKPLLDIYKKPDVVSEVTSQILYGEKFKIISKNKSWIKIKVLFDNYTGYITKITLKIISQLIKYLF